jgi:hypothetical protein
LPKYGRSYFSPIYNTFKIAELGGIDRLSTQLHVYNNYINIILLVLLQNLEKIKILNVSKSRKTQSPELKKSRMTQNLRKTQNLEKLKILNVKNLAKLKI